jgi:hypothetical protein
MDSRAKTLIEMGERLFQARLPLVSLWQEVADNFYPERADFTYRRSLGDDFAAHLTTSYPILARRELGNSLSAMLRPKEEPWFHARTDRDEDEDDAEREFLEWLTGTMRRAMYDPVTQFTRATKEGDHDFAAFGQCVISVELDRSKMALLYRNWHLRDVAWRDNYAGVIDCIHRKWKPTAMDLVRLFGKNVHTKVKELAESHDGKNKYDEVECRHIVIASEDYDGDKRFPFRSVYIDVKNEHVMEDVGAWTPIYVIPRWATVSGSQYAHSPATWAALPDARLLQAMTLTLLEAGEKAANPPMIATHEVVRTDIQMFAGGTTWVDAEYDEKLGEALRPVNQDYSGVQYGLEMNDRVGAMIKEAFFLNQIAPLPTTGEMTAFEVGQRIQDYIRKALPLFEPIEQEYNGALCDRTLSLLLRNGAVPLEIIPDSLKGQDIRFRFESPLHEIAERKKGNLLLEARALTLTAAEINPTSTAILNAPAALRDALKGIGAPAKWMNSEEAVAEAQEEAAAQEQAASMLESAKVASEAAANLGKATQAFEPAV